MSAESAVLLAERIAYAYAETVDSEWGCCHSAEDLRRGGRAPEFDDDEFEPLGDHCPGRDLLDVWLPQIEALRTPPVRTDGGDHS